MITLSEHKVTLVAEGAIGKVFRIDEGPAKGKYLIEGHSPAQWGGLNEAGLAVVDQGTLDALWSHLNDS